MLLIIILESNAPYGERKEIKARGVSRTAVEGSLLVAYNGQGDRVAQFNLEDVRNYHLEED